MKSRPVVPHVSDAPAALFETGHLWLFEQIDGSPFRFQVRDSGLLRFGDSTRTYETASTVPIRHQHAVRHIRDHIDRETLRDAVDTPDEIVFFGIGTHHHTIEYDWDRLPSFLGTDIWVATTGFLSIDRVDQIFERLGLRPLNTFARELNTRDFDIDSYTMPESQWYNGPPAGLLIRDKAGRAAQLPHPEIDSRQSTVVTDMTAAEAVKSFATDELFTRISNRLETQENAVTVDAVRARAVESIVRRNYSMLFDGTPVFDFEAFRSGVGTRTHEFLGPSE